MSMRFAIGAAIVAGCLSGRVASGAFLVTRSQPVRLTPTLFRVDLFAKNLGGDTGTRLLGAEVRVDTQASGNLIWRSTNAGVPDIRNLLEAPNRSFVRIGSEEIETNFTAQSPHSAWPFLSAYGPNTVSMPVGGAVYVGSTTGGVPASTGNGVLFGQLVFTSDFVGTIRGEVGGTIGPGYPYGPFLISVPEPASLAAAALGAVVVRRRRPA